MFSTVPLDVVKTFIVPNLDEKSFRAFFSTCKHFYGMYSPMERLYLNHMKRMMPVEIDGKIKCFQCGVSVFTYRYEDHILRCARDDRKCSMCDSINMRPQYNAKKEHPLIGCQECGKGISKFTRGCIHCKLFYCKENHCLWCSKDYISCRKHICGTDPIERWVLMLNVRRQCFGMPYNKEMLVSENRIVGKTMLVNGRSCFIYWVIVDREELAGRVPNVANGYDIFFIVDKDSIEIKDDDLIAAHYGCAGKDKKWIVFKPEAKE